MRRLGCLTPFGIAAGLVAVAAVALAWLAGGGSMFSPGATCHTNPQQYAAYTCYNCHAHPQAATLGKHREEGISENIDDCVSCHATGHE